LKNSKKAVKKPKVSHFATLWSDRYAPRVVVRKRCMLVLRYAYEPKQSPIPSP